jgi:hypothetical protein
MWIRILTAIALLAGAAGCERPKFENPKTKDTFQPQQWSDLEAGVGKKTTVSGRAREVDDRAVIEMSGVGTVLMGDIPAWPDGMAGSYVTAVGMLRKSEDTPPIYYLENAKVTGGGFGPRKTR